MPKTKTHKIETVFALMSFGVFVASMLVVLTFGAGIYSKITEKSREGVDERACLSYIWTKTKACESPGNVYVGEFNGIPALFLDEEYDGELYRTAIYLYDGWMRELFSEAELEFSPEDGTMVAKIDALAFEQLENGLIRVDANSESAFVYPRVQGAFVVRN